MISTGKVAWGKDQKTRWPRNRVQSYLCTSAMTWIKSELWCHYLLNGENMGLPPKFTWKTNELKLRALWTWTGIDTRMKWLASLSFKPTVLSLFLARTVGCLAASFCFIWLKGNWGGQVWPQREYPAHRCGWYTMEPGERLLLLAPFLYSQLPPGDHFLISFPVWGECIDTAERLPLS